MTSFGWIRRAALGAAPLLLLVACGGDDPEPTITGSPAGESAEGSGEAAVSFAAPADGATVAGRFTVDMEATGITVAPAGEAVEGEMHFHIMIDTPCVATGEVVPSDDQHRHFGKGQTSTQLELEPGEHTLCLQAADGTHVALPITDEITVTVDESLPVVTLGVPEEPTSPLAVTMSVENFTVAPAGEVVDGSGHFHVMVDTDCVEVGEVIPGDDQHLHFGGGQTEAEIELEPGEHTLCLQLGDGEHVALPYTHVVTVVIP